VKFIVTRGRKTYREVLDGIDALRALDDLAGNLPRLQTHKKVTIDMDGVLIQDDNAMTATEIVGGPLAKKFYSVVADQNIEAIAQGEDMAYCWYAPCVFFGQLMFGLPTDINRIVGKHMRLIPGAEVFIHKLKEAGYLATVVTAGVQEAAKSVAERIRIDTRNVIGTRFTNRDGAYDGRLNSFIGGTHKLKRVKHILGTNDTGYKGGHLGDSWSDVETLAAVEDSIAFNPGCEPALRGAKIAVVANSLYPLIPLFAPGEGNDRDLPDIVLLQESPAPDEIIEEVMQASRTMKKQTLPKQLNRICPYETIVANIKADLEAADLVYRNNTFPDPKEFDAVAKGLFEEYKKNGSVRLR